MPTHRTLLMPLFCAALAVGGIWIKTDAQAQNPNTPVLDSLEPGLWELNFQGKLGMQSLCIKNGRELVQLRHPTSKCTQYVIESGNSHITVQYTCGSDGYGRTNIRKETRRLAQISGHGIKGAAPFEFTAEARHMGMCTP